MSDTDPREPKDAPKADEPAPAALSDLPGLGNIEIVIGDDGEVIFTDLPAELVEVALSLDPESDLACRLPEPPSE